MRWCAIENRIQGPPVGFVALAAEVPNRLSWCTRSASPAGSALDFWIAGIARLVDHGGGTAPAEAMLSARKTTHPPQQPGRDWHRAFTAAEGAPEFGTLGITLLPTLGEPMRLWLQPGANLNKLLI